MCFLALFRCENIKFTFLFGVDRIKVFICHHGYAGT